MTPPDAGLPRPERERAVELAYRALSHRDRTVAELRTSLERKRVGPEAIQAAVAELAAAGYLDDRRYAERFADDKRSLERWGPERIARDLARRGIEPEVIEGVLGEGEPADELARALDLLADKLRVPPASERDRDRAWSMLVRRGYPPELAYDAVREFSRAEAA